MKISKPTKIMLIGSAVYVAIWSLLTSSTDLLGALIYIGIAGLVGLVVDQVDGNKRCDFVSIGITAAAAAIIYNVAGQFSGWFTIDMSSVLLGALQQGILTGLAWVGFGGKK
jgi:hypothetical protein